MTLTSRQSFRLAQWTRRYRGELLKRARSISSMTTSDLEDAVQETLLKAITHYETLDGKADVLVLGYLGVVLVNVLRGHWRRSKVAKSGTGELGHISVAFELPEPALERWRLPSDEQLAVAVELSLPAQMRRAYEFRRQGLSYRQIAQELGITTGSVGSLLADARERLREQFFGADESNGNAGGDSL